MFISYSKGVKISSNDVILTARKYKEVVEELIILKSFSNFSDYENFILHYRNGILYDFDAKGYRALVKNKSGSYSNFDINYIHDVWNKYKDTNIKEYGTCLVGKLLDCDFDNKEVCTEKINDDEKSKKDDVKKGLSIATNEVIKSGLLWLFLKDLAVNNSSFHNLFVSNTDILKVILFCALFDVCALFDFLINIDFSSNDNLDVLIDFIENCKKINNLTNSDISALDALKNKVIEIKKIRDAENKKVKVRIKKMV